MESDTSLNASITLYALSTCVWCRKTKLLLTALGRSFLTIEIDRLSGIECNQATSDLLRWNPAGSYPTLVINNERCIIGYNEQVIRDACSPPDTGVNR